METFLKSIDSLIDRLLTRETLTEIAAVLATFGLAWFLGRFVRDWLVRRESPAPTTFRGSLAEGAKKLSPFVVALLLLFVVRSVLDAVDLSTVFLDLTLRLLSALVLIRVGVFLLRLSLGPTTWLNGKHTIFGTVVDEDSKRVVDAIGAAKTGPGDRPIEDIAIQRVVIER